MTSLRLTRTYAAAPDRVWHALTEPGALAAWFWPARFNTTAEIDLRVGGRYRLCGSAAGMTVSGEYLEVTAPSRLVFSWQWEGEPDTTVVTVEIAPSGEGTELVLVHDRFAAGTTRDDHAQGWADCLDRLPAWLAAPALS
jgi:uncharacterized protein YndB with AHSA1/START domain